MSYDPSIIFGGSPLPTSFPDPTEVNTSQGPIVSTMFTLDDFKNHDITFPPDVVESVKLSYASFSREQLIPITKEFSECWELVVPVEVPGNFNSPKLLSVEYTFKYATTGDKGSSTLQTDLVLTTALLSSGIHRLQRHGHVVYRDMENEYGLRTINKDTPAWNLVTSFGVKPKGGQPGWSHYVDHQRTTLGIGITHPSHLYFILSVMEYPSTLTLRSVAVEITSKWQDVPRPSHDKTPIVAADRDAPRSILVKETIPDFETASVASLESSDNELTLWV